MFESIDLVKVLELGGWEHSLIWPIRVCTAEQDMVFKVVSLKEGLQFHY